MRYKSFLRWTSLLLLIVGTHTSVWAQPTVKLRNIEAAPGSGYTVLSDGTGKLYYVASANGAITVNNTPIAYVPAASGNPSNNNEVVTDPNGDIWVIDDSGNAVKISSVVTGAETDVNAGTGISITGTGTSGDPYIINTTITQADGSETDINAGSNITVTGSGTSGDPYIISATPGSADGSETKVTAGTNITVSGTGTLADPYVINSTAAGTGDVVGPGSATDNGVARYSGNSGDTIQNSLVTIDDSGNIALPGSVDGRFIAEDGDILDDHADTLIVHDNRLVALEQNANEVEDSLAQHRADIDSKGDLSGPASSTDNRIATFDGTTGKLLQQSGVSLDGTSFSSGSPISFLDSTYLGSFARIYMNYDSPLTILRGYDMEQGWHFYNSEEDLNWYLGSNYEGVYFQGEMQLFTYFPSYDFELDSSAIRLYPNGTFFEDNRATPSPPKVRGFGETVIEDYQDGDYESLTTGHDDALAPIGLVKLLDTLTVLSNDTIYYKVKGVVVGFDVLPAGGGGVTSVNSQTGIVVLDADDIGTTGTTNKFITSGDLIKLSTIEANATQDQAASEVPHTDAGGYYTTDNSEAIAQQIGSEQQIQDDTLAAHNARISSVENGEIERLGTYPLQIWFNAEDSVVNIYAQAGINLWPDVDNNGTGNVILSGTNGGLVMSNKQIKGVAPATLGTDAVNKNQLDSLITAFQEITDSTSITVDLEGKHNKIVRIDMTGVSNAGTITLQSPLNPFSSANEVGVYTFHITNADTHDFDFPSSFVDIEGTAYDASSTVEVVSALIFTCYYDGTNYICQ